MWLVKAVAAAVRKKAPTSLLYKHAEGRARFAAQRTLSVVHQRSACDTCGGSGEVLEKLMLSGPERSARP